MSADRPFRFGVKFRRAETGAALAERSRKIESMGYSTLLFSDHFRDVLGPLTGAMAAAATTTLRVGTNVLGNDFRHPVVLAKEIATVDRLSDGRFELGLGAGWMADDYERAGMRMDRPGIRIERTEERGAAERLMSERFDLPPERAVTVPHGWVGPIGKIVEDLHAWRERWGVSYWILQDETADELAPLVAKLAGT